MKRPLFFILYLMLFNHSNITPIEKMQIKQNLYTYYFIIKEFYNLITSPEFTIDHIKLGEAKIICNGCNQFVRASQLLACLIVCVQEPLLKELMLIVNNGSIEDLTLFTLNTYLEHQIECPECQERFEPD